MDIYTIVEKVYSKDKAMAMNFIKARIHPKTPLEDAEDIFINSIIKAQEKVENKCFKTELTYVNFKKLLFGIIKIKILEFRRKQADIAWLNSSTNEGNSRNWEDVIESQLTDVFLHPPSYYYAKKYWESNKDKFTEYSKKYYYKNHAQIILKARKLYATDSDVRRRMSNRKKIAYKKMKEDPVKYRIYLDKLNARKRDLRYRRSIGDLSDKRRVTIN